jgi:TonB family protein
MPVPIRAAFWLASAGMHAAILVAAGHSPFAESAGRFSVADERPVEIVAAVEVAPEDLQPAPTRTGMFVPPLTHTHPYPVAPDHDVHPHDPSLVHVPFLVPSSPVVKPAALPEVAAEPSAPARFAMKLGEETASIRSAATASAPAVASGNDEESGDAAPLAEAGVSVPARLANAIAPLYPHLARAEEVEADVVLSIVVSSRGTVADARVSKLAGFGFDEAALAAVRRARFTPAQKDGLRVAVRMRWTVSFRLR